MSVDGEGTSDSNATPQQTPLQQQEQQQQQQQQHQQQAQLVHQDLNFSINDILNNNHDVSDSSFQSIVQTLSNNNNEEHIAPSYAHLPAELQDLFNTNETDDLLSVQGTNSDASILQGNMSNIWDRPGASQPFLQPSPQQPIAPSPPVPVKTTSTASPIATTAAATPVAMPISSTTAAPSIANHTLVIQSSPNTSSNTPTSQPIQPQQQPQPLSRQSSQSSQQNSQPQQQPSSTTLLDNITAQLPPDRKEKFIQLFRELQTSAVSANQFLSKAKLLLGQQQYQQLEDLKNKPSQKAASSSPSTFNNANQDEEHRKRALSSQQLRQEDAQRAMPGIIAPQLKRAKTEHIPNNALSPQFHPPPQTLQQQQQLQQLQMQLQQQHQMQLLQQQHLQLQQQQQQQQQTSPSQPQLQPQQTHQPVAPSPATTQTPTVNITAAAANTTTTTQATPTPVFKTPAVPGTPGLQIPSRANTPQSSSKPTVPSGTAATANATTTTASTSGGGSSGGGGGDRIDYDTLTDVMGYAGVDLKEEAEHFMKDGDGSGGVLPDGVDRSKVQDFMNTDLLTKKILKYAKCVNIKKIDSDFVSYLALATQDRIRTVMESMVTASKHRTFDPFQKPPLSEDGHPLFKIQVKQNVKLQLEAIEHVSRQSELDLDPIDEEDMDQPDIDTTKKGWYSKKSKKPLLIKDKTERKVTVQDAIFVMERDVQGGRGTNQRTLLKAYNEWLS